MSTAVRIDQRLNCKFISFGVMFALLLGLPAQGTAEPSSPITPHDSGKKPSIEELHEHSGTIADILETASERVERLAAADTEAPALLEAIRQEISLSRRWNRHLGTILLDVAEARRSLSQREREAAKEIARMTAAVEEARLELIALRSVLQGDADETAERPDGWSDSGVDREVGNSADRQLTANRSSDQTSAEGILGPLSDLDDARERLASVEAAQTSALRDVGSVRGKIMEALQTLAASRGDVPFRPSSQGGQLSSEDITAWAASIAAKPDTAANEEAE